jgi:hypothetical protein
MSPKQNFRSANKPIGIEKFEKLTFVEQSLYLFAKKETAGTAKFLRSLLFQTERCATVTAEFAFTFV